MNGTIMRFCIVIDCRRVVPAKDKFLLIFLPPTTGLQYFHIVTFPTRTLEAKRNIRLNCSQFYHFLNITKGLNLVFCKTLQSLFRENSVKYIICVSYI